MSKIPAIVVELLVAAVILIPILLIMQKMIFRDAKKAFLYIIFSLYLAWLYRNVGMPCITVFHVDFTFHMVSLRDMLANYKESLTYIGLFLPLGLLLPLLCERFSHLIHTFVFGLCTSVLIELLQIFTYRTTDLNNLITAVIGTLIGFFLAKLLLMAVPSLAVGEDKSSDLCLTCIIVFIVLFFMQPLLSLSVWNRLL